MKMIPLSGWDSETLPNGETAVSVGKKWFSIPARDTGAASITAFKHTKKLVCLSYSEFRQEWCLMVWPLSLGVKEAERDSAPFPELELTYRNEELWCRLGEDRYAYDQPKHLERAVLTMFNSVSAMCSV